MPTFIYTMPFPAGLGRVFRWTGPVRTFYANTVAYTTPATPRFGQFCDETLVVDFEGR